MTILAIETEDKEVIKAVKALLKGFKVSFNERSESPYDPEFVEMVTAGDKEIAEGKGIKVTAEELRSLWK